MERREVSGWAAVVGAGEIWSGRQESQPAEGAVQSQARSR